MIHPSHSSKWAILLLALALVAQITLLPVEAVDESKPRVIRPLLKSYKTASTRALFAPKKISTPKGVNELSTEIEVKWGDNSIERLTGDGTRIKDKLHTRTYNGRLVGDTICVRPGDRLKRSS